MTSLSAVSPIDGRYRSKTKQLSAYFSEEALIRYRILVEVEYFIALYEQGLPQLQDVNSANFPKLRELYQDFTSIDAQAIKKIEKVTNHDVKAVEYFLKEEFEKLGPITQNEVDNTDWDQLAQDLTA